MEFNDLDPTRLSESTPAGKPRLSCSLVVEMESLDPHNGVRLRRALGKVGVAI